MLHPCPPSWPAISFALAHAQPGDVVEINDDYLQPETNTVTPVKVSGTRKAWIVIRLAAGKTMIGRAHQSPLGATPEKGDAFIKLRDSSFVRFEGLHIVNAWDNAIDTTNTSNVEFVDCNAVGGRHVFRVRGESRAIRVAGCRWLQDARI